MLYTVTLITVSIAGVYFLALAAASMLAPARAMRFLHGFASSALAHYVELILRLAVGGAFLIYAPRMLFPGAFALFGWILVVTTVCLFAVPWRWHQRIAQRAVSAVSDHLRLVAAASLTLGSLVLVSVIWGATT